MSRWYYHQKECEYCNEEFEANRYDARFCSSKCRTAHHRREKRREQAAQSMAVAWDSYTRNAYAEITNEVPGFANKIKDIFVSHNAAAAADAVKVSYLVFGFITSRTENRLNQKDEVEHRLRDQLGILNQIKALLQ